MTDSDDKEIIKDFIENMGEYIPDIRRNRIKQCALAEDGYPKKLSLSVTIIEGFLKKNLPERLEQEPYKQVINLLKRGPEPNEDEIKLPARRSWEISDFLKNLSLYAPGLKKEDLFISRFKEKRGIFSIDEVIEDHENIHDYSGTYDTYMDERPKIVQEMLVMLDQRLIEKGVESNVSWRDRILSNYRID